MFRRTILWRILLTLVLIAVLVGGGIALYRLAWTQGYQTGVVAMGGTDKSITPQAPYFGIYPYTPFWPVYGFPYFFNPFGLLFGIGFFLLILFLIRGLFFRPWGWRHWSGPEEHRYGLYRQHGPWDARERGEEQSASSHGSSGFSI
jgi:hypothetical protein